MEMENGLEPKVTIIKDNGIKIKYKEKGNINGLMEIYIRDNSKTV